MKLAKQILKSLREDGCFSVEFADPREYHALKPELEKAAKIPVVSKSMLIDFMEDPYKFHWKQAQGEQKKSEALRKGSLIDCLTLTPDMTGDLYIVDKIDRRTKAGKEREAEALATGKEIVTPDEYDAAMRIASMAKRELESRMDQYRTQVASYFVTDEVQGEKLPTPVIITGMFDVLPVNKEFPIIDMKTTSRNITNEKEVNRNMAEYGYGVQAAMYIDLALLGMGESRRFAFFYVTVSEPTRMRLVRVNMTDIELYRARYFEAVREYAFAWKNNIWGGPVLPDMVYEVPAWDM